MKDILEWLVRGFLISAVIATLVYSSLCCVVLAEGAMIYTALICLFMLPYVWRD